MRAWADRIGTSGLVAVLIAITAACGPREPQPAPARDPAPRITPTTQASTLRLPATVEVTLVVHAPLHGSRVSREDGTPLDHARSRETSAGTEHVWRVAADDPEVAFLVRADGYREELLRLPLESMRRPRTVTLVREPATPARRRIGR